MSFEGFGPIAASYDIADQESPKRAVIKPAPTCFTVEVLAPVKHGRAYSYGVRILPVNPHQLQAMREYGDDIDTTSIQSAGREYEIWRRWDDCLDFQDKLEAEYERLSREKKRGLRHGKKSSGDGVYRNPKAAASFESLPEGPDPKSIKIDLHAYVPRLSRKSSFFSVSDAMVQKRAEEFATMIYALFKMDCPKLIEDLRDSTTVRDFFAWWRRDQDLAEKTMPQRPNSTLSAAKPGPGARRMSVDSSSIFTAPPSPDSPGFSMLKRQEKIYVHPQRSPTESSMPIQSPTQPTSAVSPPPRVEKMLPSPPMSPEHAAMTSPFRRALPPMSFRGRGGNPHLHISRPMVHPQYGDNGFGLLSPVAETNYPQVPVTRSRTERPFQATEVPHLRVAASGSSEGSSDSSTPPITPVRSSFATVRERERPVSEISMDSIDSSDINLDLSFIKLEPAPLGVGKTGMANKRESIVSISSLTSVNSVRTTDSADGVLPHALRRQTRVSQRSRQRDGPWSPDIRFSAAVPEEDESTFYHSDDSQDGADPFGLEIDAKFDNRMSYLEKIDSFPDVPVRGLAVSDGDSAAQEYCRDRDWRMSFPASVRESMYDPDFDFYYADEPSSPTSTIHGGQPESDSGHSTHSASTVTSLALEPGMCSVKAKYDDVIVALRLPVGTPLSTLRARLSEKFLQAQGVQLHYRYNLAYAPPRHVMSGLCSPEDTMPIILSPAALEFSGHRTSRDSASVRPDSVFGSTPLTRLIPIWTQDDLETALQTCGNRIVLHVLDQQVY